jgi:cellulose synthase/poly-beta-1,6-N-acetylglucosamine synthase-like glycosyltransferase
VKKFMLEHPELDIKLIEEDKRLGKSNAVNKAFSSARPQSEIIMMTDVDVHLEKDAIEKVVSNFGDPTVGAVCGRQVLINPQESKETKMEATYQRFYEKLRIGESVIDSTPLFEGQFAAYRANVIQGENVIENANADDCQLAITVRRKGFKAIYDEQAVFYEYAPPDKASLQLQKIRRGQGLARLFWQNKDMIFKKKYGRFGLYILPANFFMYVVSPFLVSGFIILCFASLSFYLIECRDLTWVTASSMLAGVTLAMCYFTQGKKYLNIVWTFLEYQLMLLRGILLILGGRSLHKWRKVDKIREKYNTHAPNRKSVPHSCVKC